MVQRNGGFHLLREEEKDIREEKTEMKLSAARDTMWNGGNGGKLTQINTFDKKNEKTVSDGVIEKHLINGLQSQKREDEETQSKHALLERGPSFKLTKGAEINQNKCRELIQKFPILLLKGLLQQSSTPVPVKHA